MSSTGRVSAVIVNYNTPELTHKCVESIARFGVANRADIIVVDNASPDGSGARLSRELEGVKVICSNRNAGFSAGVNIGAAAARCEYLLVLNPDTYFVDQSICLALEILDQCSDVGLVGLDLVYPDGKRQFSARRFYSILDILGRRLPIGRYWPLKRRIEDHMMLTAWDSETPFDADWVMGTGFVVRRDLFERVGRMDEGYFLYMEDVELCARMWGAGSRVVCVPNARLVHDHQRSSAAGPFSWAGRMHLKSLRLFSRKYRVPLLTPPDVSAVSRLQSTGQPRP
ncbi:glycosyltransferase family 2 protein [Denitromonas iodatirespirans]|uniref:Glycosyltransferase family 2 protein n=1 Tax=Denitromonas iodatirespirans TaxID=2795389 RepID=A0A944DE25_DENI1|nr:glycosyltransferase family 2 protein [Denitromonas iodatirespirans]MBT0962758.1 glycosyltransferase family 2 protein [Denitromonas iodatirespirans]